MPEPSQQGEAANSAEMFNHTRWSLVAAVRESAADGNRNRLEELSASYWFPVYACIGRQWSPAGPRPSAGRPLLQRIGRTDP